MPVTWLAMMPNLSERIDQLEDADLKTLFILTNCYWCLGRIQGVQDATMADE